MNERPPRIPARLLDRALGPSDEARAVLGDLEEDYTETARRDGLRRARAWYWSEALSLATSALAGRALGRPLVRRSGVGHSDLPEPSLVASVIQDVGYALRALRREPVFFAFTTLVIGLGVGASTAVYSVTSPLLLRPLPLAEPHRLVLIENTNPAGGLSGVTSRTSNLRDFRELSRSFTAVAGYNAFFDQASYNLTDSGEPSRLVGVNVTANFLDVLGVQPVVGRSFTREEGRWGGFVAEASVGDGPRAMILTHAFWTQRFGAERSIVGRTLRLNDEPVTVVGVLPQDFDFASVFTPTAEIDFLLPWPVADATDSWGNTTTMVARLRPGATVESAQAELDAVVAGLEEADPQRWGLGAVVSGLQERIARPVRPGLLLLAAAAGTVMLIVCLNVSNVLLARSPRRRREMAIRRTLGATRPRLMRQLLAESVLMSAAGATFGVFLAFGATRFVASRPGLQIPLLSTVSVDATAFAFTAALALVAGLAVGVVPALQVSEGRESEALGGSARGGGGSRGARRLREVLVVVEVAMACVLLVFGGLVLRSFQGVMAVDTGFDADELVAWQLSSSRDFETLSEVIVFHEEVRAAVDAVPGVEAVGLVDALPLGTNRTWSTTVVGKQYERGEADQVFPHIADASYLSTMGIPLVEGRYLSRDDADGSPLVIVVNETAARTMFDGDALGRSISIFGTEAEVVGVVGDVKHRALELESDSEVYFAMTQLWSFSTVDLVVRTSLAPREVIGGVATALGTVDPRMPTEDVRTLGSLVERSVSPRRFTLQLLVAFAATALVLAAIGIYGVLSYSVTERLPEIGIRMALGESASEVRRGVVSRTAALAGLGVLIGSVASLFGARLLGALLFGVEPTDPLTFAGTVAVLMFVALLSGLLPAIRASRTDSATALRSA